MMSSTLRRGFSDEIGSWKIIFMRVRVRRSSSPEQLRHVVAFEHARVPTSGAAAA